MATMTYDEAIQQAVTLRKQGLTYPAIEEHLKKAGYISPHSKGPVGSLAVRAMVSRASKDQPTVKTVKIGPISAPKSDLLEVIRAVAGANELSIDARLVAVRTLLKTFSAT